MALGLKPTDIAPGMTLDVSLYDIWFDPEDGRQVNVVGPYKVEVVDRTNEPNMFIARWLDQDPTTNRILDVTHREVHSIEVAS